MLVGVSFSSLLSTCAGAPVAADCSPGVDAVPEHIEQTRMSSRRELKSIAAFWLQQLQMRELNLLGV